MATVWAAVAATALCAVFAALLTMGSVVTARHRAGGAADLAALAAADHALEGERAACTLAGRVARAQGAHLVRCAVRGEIADLTVEVPAAGVMSALPAGVSGKFVPRVRARAGPPTSDLPGPTAGDPDRARTAGTGAVGPTRSRDTPPPGRVGARRVVALAADPIPAPDRRPVRGQPVPRGNEGSSATRRGPDVTPTAGPQRMAPG
ncbi:Rv3654c family TadE-like protein [Streptomyces sp. 796.1]|uniref:Rv3654c family TadE-like protein n=1 Tax=Streptomyces sp. 796.1 TaxID=3163029 RepID=UPI0039C9B8F4